MQNIKRFLFGSSRNLNEIRTKSGKTFEFFFDSTMSTTIKSQFIHYAVPSTLNVRLFFPVTNTRMETV